MNISSKVSTLSLFFYRLFIKFIQKCFKNLKGPLDTDGKWWWLFLLEYVGFSSQNVREENFRQKE